MDIDLFTNLVQTSMLTVAVMGVILLAPYYAFRGVCLFLILVAIAGGFNIYESLSNDPSHLVTPIFVLGFGPAIYLAVKQVVIGKLAGQDMLHFLPMLIALPFTHYWQIVIVVGTCWRVAYAILTIQLLWQFKTKLMQARSDADEFSLQWLAWLIGISSFLNAVDLIRLNFQTELGYQLNTFGFALMSIFSLLIITLLVCGFNYHRVNLQKLAKLNMAIVRLSNDREMMPAEGEGSEYRAIFEHLDAQIQEHTWYCKARLTLQQLSELSGLQSRDISRAINLTANMSFNDYINNLRIEYIKQKIKSGSNDSLLDIALSAGFSSKATFNQAFKKLHGQTPSQYRKNLLK